MTRMETRAAPASATRELSLLTRWAAFGYLLPWLVLVFCLISSFLLWKNARDESHQELQDYFSFRVREVLDTTTQRLQTYQQVLRGAQGLFNASESVGRTEFKDYVAALKLADNYPGIQGVGYALAIPPEEKERHTAALHQQGFPQYTIHPSGKRALYTSIIYLEPFAERNLRAFGYDMYAEPVRHEAMERARDTAQPAMSGKVLLVQEAKQDIQAGFLIYLPVYRNGMPHHTLAQRRANLVGWVYSAFRMGDLMHGIYGEQADDLDIDIFDGQEATDQSQMYDSHNDYHDIHKPQPRFSVIRPVEIAGHTWTMAIRSRPSMDSRVDAAKPLFIAYGGAIASLLLTLLTWMLVHGRKRAVQLAHKMNHELISSEQALRDSKAKLQAILDHASVAIGWADENGKIEYINHKFTELFGYTLADIPNVEEWSLRAHPDAGYRDRIMTQWGADITAAHQHGTPTHPAELSITCKDGSLRHAILSSAWVGNKILVSLSDITERKRNEEKLQQWAQIFEHAEWGIVVGSADGERIELVNPAFARAHGYSMEEILRLPLPELFAPEERAALPEHIRLAHAQGHHTFESRHLRKDGSTFPVLVDATTVRDEQGEVLYRVVNVQDISQLKAAEKALQDSRAILQSILDNSPYLIWLKDTAGRFIAINQAFLESTGHEEMNSVLGRTDADLWPEQLARKYQLDDEQVIASGQQKMHEEQALDKGHLTWMETFKTPVFDDTGELLGITGFARDITERKLREERIRHQAHYDTLTELPNRVLFSDRLEQAIAHAKRDKSQLAVMFLDLDRFKPVNDLFGHDVGDMLLREVAKRIHECVRESDTVARIGGDEFCILLPVIEAGQDAATVAEKVRHALCQPFMLNGHSIHIACSIGVAVYPKDGKSSTLLVKHADIAMYAAKAEGRDRVVIFETDMSGPTQQAS